MHSYSHNESGRKWSTRLAHRFAPVLLWALAGCIADQGSSRVESDAAPAADDSAAPPDAGTQESGDAGSDAPTIQSVTRKLEGLANDGWVITDENGKPGPDGPGTMDVPANAKVHLILSSDPTGETHKFEITIPNDSTPNVDMPPIPGSATLDWTAPSTPNRYVGGINCTAHKGMVADIVVHP